MAKAKPEKQQASGSDNLLLAVGLITGFAGVSAFSSAYIAGYVLDTLQSREALVMIVTDGGAEVRLGQRRAGAVIRDDGAEGRPRPRLGLGRGVPRGRGGGLPTLPPSKRLLGQARGVYCPLTEATLGAN